MDKVFDYILKAVLIGDGIAIFIAIVITVVITLIVRGVIENYKKNLNKELEEFKKEQNKEIEKLKTQLGNKSYVTKTRFDKEFEVYQTLIEHIWLVYNQISNVQMTRLRLFEDKNILDLYKSEIEKLSGLLEELNHFNLRSAAFIDEEKFKMYNNFESLARNTLLIMLAEIDDCRTILFGRINIDDKCTPEEISNLIYGNCHKLNRQLKDINDTVRDYLNSLDVIE